VWRFARLPKRPGIRSDNPQGEYDAVSRNSRRAVATAVAGVFAAAPLVSGCAAGEHPQSALPTRLVEGVNASAHQVDIRNAFLLGPASGQRLAAGGSAPLYAWFVNNDPSPDRLVAAQAPGVAQSVEIAGGAVELPPTKLVNLVETAPAAPTTSPTPTPTPKTPKRRAAKPGRSPNSPTRQPASPGTSASGTPGAPAGTPSAPAAPSAPSSKLILKGLTRAFSGGETVRVTLAFQRAGTITLDVPVVPRNGYYATYAPAPAAPTPSATPQPGLSQPPAGSTSPTAGTPQKAGTSRKARLKKRASATPSA
jgi:copper(I)-binding protein